MNATDEFKVGEFWASQNGVLWKVSASDESLHASYAVLTRAKTKTGRITVPAGATSGWERIFTAPEARAFGAVQTMLKGMR